VPLFQSLHLLLFFVTTVNSFSHGTTDRAANILASMVVTEHIPGTNTMGD
jgi:hypothetical protein